MPISEFYLKGASKAQLIKEADLPREKRSQEVRTIYFYFRWGTKERMQHCTKERILQCDWIEKDKKGLAQRVNPKVMGADQINEVLEELKGKVEKAERDIRMAGGVATLSQLEDVIAPPPIIVPEEKALGPILFFQFFKDYHKSVSNGDKKNFQKCLVHLEAFNAELTWENFTKGFRNDYIEFLSTKYINSRTKKVGILNGTIGKDIRCIKAVLQEADTSGIDVPRWYLKYKRPKYNSKKDARRFSIVEDRLNDLILFDFADKDLYTKKENFAKVIRNIEAVRDHYVFSFYTGLSHEARVSLIPDQITEDVDDTGLPIKVIDISRSKTHGRNAIPLNQICLDIIERHKGNQFGILPYYCNQHFNKISKRMFKLAGFTKKITLVRWSGDRKIIETFEEWQLLTSHTARHSSAEHILDNSDGNLKLVKDLLGHGSISTTEIYTRGSKKKFNGEILRITEKTPKLKVS